MVLTHADNATDGLAVHGGGAELVAAPAPRRSLSLYALEDDLLAIWNSIDMVEGEKEREEAEQMLLAAYLAAVEKRDKVGHFLAHLDTQKDAIDKEIERLKALKQRVEKAEDKTEKYIIHTIQSLGLDDRGNYPKLEGNTVSFSIRANPPSVQVDPEAVPDEFQTVTVKVNSAIWNDFVDNLDLEEKRGFLKEAKVTKEPAKAEIGKYLKARLAEAEKSPDQERAAAVEDAGQSVPGARMLSSGYRLVRK